MMRFMMISLLTLVLAMPAMTAEATPGTDVCIDNRSINGWSVDGDRSIIVTLGASRRYRMELGLAASVVGLGLQDRIAFLPRADGSLCAGWSHVLADGRRIPIRTITRLAEDAGKAEK